MNVFHSLEKKQNVNILTKNIKTVTYVEFRPFLAHANRSNCRLMTSL